MLVTRLELRNLRNLREVSLRPRPGLNLLIGDNGAGKTSVLEGLHLMAYGRSFRGRVRDGLIRSGCDAVEVFIEWNDPALFRQRRAGLRHGGGTWEGRLDGEKVPHLGELCAAFMVVTFEPGSHALVSGGAEPRRRFLDWGLFHVEQAFLTLWRRYARGLKQRNALLKSGAGARQLAAWDLELSESGELLTRERARYLDRLQAGVGRAIEQLAPELGQVELILEPGWRRDAMPLADALTLAEDRDRSFGHTTVGPHRADWRLQLSTKPAREPLSRGQAKLAALACLLAQAEDCAALRGGWPAIALDDLASELDPGHRERVLSALLATGAQLFITGTEPLAASAAAATFHVERGEIREIPRLD